jgi:sortase A
MGEMRKMRAGRGMARRAEMKKMRTGGGLLRRLFSMISLLMVVLGLGIVGWALLNPESPIPRMATGAISGQARDPAVAAKSTTLKLTVPDMRRVKDLPVYTAPADDVATLDAGALHVQGTGFPWDAGSNVYIAGHRLGYAGTKSFLVFYDLDKLQNGDEILLTDSNGTKYTYTVYEKQVVDPTNYSATKPVPNKSIVTLQTCTLPDYSQRLLVRGELTSVT